MNKTILITGAAKRIGKEIALTYSDLGWNIIIHYNSSKDDAEDLAQKINLKNPDTAKIIQANLDIDVDVERLVQETKDMFDSIDILVNNASTFYPTPIDEISNEHWMKLVGSNLKGPLFLISGLKDKLKESNGSIINITDTNLSKGVANYSIYSAAKAGLESITKGLARELAPEITVNAIAPGAMLEPPDVEWTDEQKEKVISNIPLKRMGSEKDIANAVKFVASSKYMTGQTIKVDGGRSLS
jgi:pteridine reductase